MNLNIITIILMTFLSLCSKLILSFEWFCRRASFHKQKRSLHTQRGLLQLISCMYKAIWY